MELVIITGSQQANHWEAREHCVFGLSSPQPSVKSY
jgi:hypothetical protein